MIIPKKIVEHKFDVYFNEKNNEYYVFILQENNLFNNKHYFIYVGDKNEVWNMIGKRVGYIGAKIMNQFSFYKGDYCTMENYIKYCRFRIENPEPIENLFNNYTILAMVEMDGLLSKADNHLKNQVYQAIYNNNLLFIGEKECPFRHLYTREILKVEELRKVIKTLPIMKTKEFTSQIKLIEKRIKKW